MKAKKLTLSAAVFFLLGCIALYFWVTDDLYFVKLADTENEASVALSFVLGLSDNKEVKSLAVSNLWPEIDNWQANHKVFRCSAFWPIPDGSTWGVASETDVNTIEYEWQDQTICANEGVYYFRIEGLELKKIDNEWVVFRWQKICETRPGQDEVCFIYGEE